MRGVEPQTPDDRVSRPDGGLSKAMVEIRKVRQGECAVYRAQ